MIGPLVLISISLTSFSLGILLGISIVKLLQNPETVLKAPEIINKRKDRASKLKGRPAVIMTPERDARLLREEEEREDELRLDSDDE